MATTTPLPRGMLKRGGAYHANFRVNGRRVRKALSRNLRSATTMLIELRSRIERGDWGILDNDYPWSDLKRAFMQWAKRNIRDAEDYARSLRHFENFASPKNVRDVTAERIDAYRNWRLDQGVTPRTVNKEVGTISNMLNKGVERFKVIDHNPIAEVKPLVHVELKKERRPLSLEEVEALFDASPNYLKPVWRMFMLTGIRKSELVSLQFSDVDWERQTITVRASVSKSKRGREIPVDDTAMGLLIELRDQAADRQPCTGGTAKQTARIRANFSADHIFVTQVNTPLRNNLLRKFYACCKRADIVDAKRTGSVDIHALRVSFTTLSLEHGANPKAIQTILGHSTLAMTMSVYAKATERSLRDAISALPFASAVTPKHVVPMHSAATKTATSNSDRLQVQAG